MRGFSATRRAVRRARHHAIVMLLLAAEGALGAAALPPVPGHPDMSGIVQEDYWTARDRGLSHDEALRWATDIPEQPGDYEPYTAAELAARRNPTCRPVSPEPVRLVTPLGDELLLYETPLDSGFQWAAGVAAAQEPFRRALQSPQPEDPESEDRGSLVVTGFGGNAPLPAVSEDMPLTIRRYFPVGELPRNRDGSLRTEITVDVVLSDGTVEHVTLGYGGAGEYVSDGPVSFSHGGSGATWGTLFALGVGNGDPVRFSQGGVEFTTFGYDNEPERQLGMLERSFRTVHTQLEDLLDEDPPPEARAIIERMLGYLRHYFAISEHRAVTTGGGQMISVATLVEIARQYANLLQNPVGHGASSNPEYSDLPGAASSFVGIDNFLTRREGRVLGDAMAAGRARREAVYDQFTADLAFGMYEWALEEMVLDELMRVAGWNPRAFNDDGSLVTATGTERLEALGELAMDRVFDWTLSEVPRMLSGYARRDGALVFGGFDGNGIYLNGRNLTWGDGRGSRAATGVVDGQPMRLGDAGTPLGATRRPSYAWDPDIGPVPYTHRIADFDLAADAFSDHFRQNLTPYLYRLGERYGVPYGNFHGVSTHPTQDIGAFFTVIARRQGFVPVNELFAQSQVEFLSRMIVAAHNHANGRPTLVTDADLQQLADWTTHPEFRPQATRAISVTHDGSLTLTFTDVELDMLDGLARDFRENRVITSDDLFRFNELMDAADVPATDFFDARTAEFAHTFIVDVPQRTERFDAILEVYPGIPDTGFFDTLDGQSTIIVRLPPYDGGAIANQPDLRDIFEPIPGTNDSDDPFEAPTVIIQPRRSSGSGTFIDGGTQPFTVTLEVPSRPLDGGFPPGFGEQSTVIVRPPPTSGSATFDPGRADPGTAAPGASGTGRFDRVFDLYPWIPGTNDFADPFEAPTVLIRPQSADGSGTYRDGGTASFPVVLDIYPAISDTGRFDSGQPSALAGAGLPPPPETPLAELFDDLPVADSEATRRYDQILDIYERIPGTRDFPTTGEGGLCLPDGGSPDRPRITIDLGSSSAADFLRQHPEARHFDTFRFGGRDYLTIEIDLPRGPEASHVASQLDGLFGDEYPLVEQDFPREAQQTFRDTFAGPTEGNAPTQWYLDALGVDADSWRVGWQRAETVTVAVIDSGLAWDHADFALERLWINSGEIPGNRVDDDANGYSDDIVGWDFVHGHHVPWDDYGHGTFVTGLIAATPDNGIGIAGLAPNARIMNLKVLDGEGRTTSSRLARAIAYAVDNGARIINLSVGGPGLSELERRAVDYAADQGVLVVVAAGNAGAATDTFGPAALERALVVGAVDRRSRRSVYSNQGRAVDLAAPGDDLVSLRARYTNINSALGRSLGDSITPSNRNYLVSSGTSFAAPLVTALAAVIVGTEPDITLDGLRRRLTQSARDIEVPGVDFATGYGLLQSGALDADEEFFIDARIESVAIAMLDGWPFIEVRGTADASDFAHYAIELGQGSSPTRFEAIGDAVRHAVRGGSLASFDARKVRDARQWTLRVVVADGHGRERESRFLLTLR